MSLKKKYLKSKQECKVTFRFPGEAAANANTVNLVGDFNNWDIYATPMKKLKSGDFTVQVNLSVNHEYKFRYLIDETDWENDWDADGYAITHYGNSENSVVAV